MKNLFNNLNNFLQGRYGIDQLGQGIFALYIIAFVLNIITRQSIFYIIGIILVAVFLYRCLSKDFAGRQKENDWYRSRFTIVQRKINLYKRMWQDRNTHVYRKCPHCKTVIRLPKVKGKHTTTCPK